MVCILCALNIRALSLVTYNFGRVFAIRSPGKVQNNIGMTYKGTYGIGLFAVAPKQKTVLATTQVRHNNANQTVANGLHV